MKFLRDLLTNVSGEHYELGRVGLALFILAAIGFQGFALYKGQSFDPISFATGAGALLAAGGFGIAQKDIARAKSCGGE